MRRLDRLASAFGQAHGRHGNWTFAYEYPGYFAYQEDGGTRVVFFTPDWETKGFVEPVVMKDWPESDEVLELGPAVPFLKEEGPERLFSIVRPLLDKHSGSGLSPSLGGVPEDIRLERPWEHTFPLERAVANVFGGRKEWAPAYEAVLRRVGEEPHRELGAGEKGVAYALPSGRVLKLTADEDELRAMAVLKGAPDHPNLVKVHDAFVVRGNRTGLGVIVRDAVDETLYDAGRYQNLASHLRYSVLRANDRYIRRRNLVHPRQALWEAMLFLVEEIEGEPLRRLEADERALIPGIREAVMGLNERGIFTIDLTPGNIGLTDGRAVLFDLSNASVPEDVVEVV